MRNFYFAVTEEDRGNDGIVYQWSYVKKADSSLNLANAFRDKKAVSIFPSKKEADKVVHLWNQCAKENDRYIGDHMDAFI